MQSPQNPYDPTGASSGQPDPQRGQLGGQSAYSPAPVGYGAPIASPTDNYAQRGGLQSGVRTIRRVDVLSAAKFGAVMSAAMVAIFGLFFLMFAGPIMASLPGRGAGMGLAGGFVGYLFAIIFYGIFGGIGGAIYAVIYNLVAGAVGGLQIEIE